MQCLSKLERQYWYDCAHFHSITRTSNQQFTGTAETETETPNKCKVVQIPFHICNKYIMQGGGRFVFFFCMSVLSIYFPCLCYHLVFTPRSNKMRYIVHYSFIQPNLHLMAVAQSRSLKQLVRVRASQSRSLVRVRASVLQGRLEIRRVKKKAKRPRHHTRTD